MKYTTDYVIGNTAIQIVETGRRIKVIDVEGRREKKVRIRNVLLMTVLSVLLISCCYSIIKDSSRSVVLSHEIVALNSEIERLQKETDDMLSYQVETIDYDALLKAAVENYGMVFPENDQIYTYKPVKSNAIRAQE